MSATNAPADERVLAAAPRLDFDRIRADVEALAAMERGSAADAKPQVAWIQGRLRDAGAHDVRTESFPFQRRWFWRHGTHMAAGVGAAVAGGAAGAALAAATLASFELEVAGRSSWTARFLPAGAGVNVIARVPAAGPADRTVVFVAHHDTARTGLLWRLPKTGRPLPLPAEAAFAAVIGGCLLGSRALRAVAGAALVVLGLIGLDVARSRVVPGANDNATGVGALLALTAAFARDPLERTDVVAVFTDCEEVGLGGAAAWLRAHGAELDKATTLVLSLDTLGSGEPAVVSRDGALTATYARDDHDWADRGALRAAVAPPRRTDLGAPTDAIVARHAGFRALSLVSVDADGTLGDHYHQLTDTPENVDWDSVEQCTRLAGGITRVWDAAG
jgi:acetylornithine deacetylase/succinyl-diaminopimelate desuccinylase-like protein